MVNKIEALPLIERKKEFNKAIRSMNKIDRDENTSFFDSDIKYFSVLRDTCDDEIPSIEAVINVNPYPRMFPCINSFKLFEALKEKVVNDIADYSYYFREMILQGVMYDIKCAEYIFWLKENYNIEIKQIKQYESCNGNKKIDIFNILYDLHKPYTKVKLKRTNKTTIPYK